MFEALTTIVDADNDKDVAKPTKTSAPSSVVKKSWEEDEELSEEEIDLFWLKKRKSQVKKYKSRLREDAKMAMYRERSAAERRKPEKVSEISPVLESTFLFCGSVSSVVVRT